MSRPDLHVVVPGSLNQRTGGYIYDARMVAGLKAHGWQVSVHELEGTFPDCDATARASLPHVLTTLPDDSQVMIDGLAMGGYPDPVRTHGVRLHILGLVHHPLADETGLDRTRRDELIALERVALSACRGVVVTSPSTAARLSDYGVAPDRIRAVPPGTDPAPVAEGPGADSPPQLLCVASVIPRKGHDVLVRALARLRARSWSCICAGSLRRDPAYATRVRALVKHECLEARCLFEGECAQKPLDELYHSSSLFVLPSYYEGYGMALTDALARGLPVVSTDGGAIPETVPAETGILVPPGDDRALAEAIDELITDPSHRRRLATAALRYAKTLPDWDHAVAAFADAIDALDPTV